MYKLTKNVNFSLTRTHLDKQKVAVWEGNYL